MLELHRYCDGVVEARLDLSVGPVFERQLTSLDRLRIGIPRHLDCVVWPLESVGQRLLWTGEQGRMRIHGAEDLGLGIGCDVLRIVDSVDSSHVTRQVPTVLVD